MTDKTQKEIMGEYGWVVHAVYETEEGELDGLCNVHTHGILETFNHPDLQIVLPIAPRANHQILSGVVDLIKNGKTFKDGDKSEEVILNLPVKFKEFQEGDRIVLRILFPDPKGRLPGEDRCTPEYKRQLKILPGEPNYDIQ